MITPSRDATSLLIFSASGKLIRRVGRAGEAPGEFRRIRRVMLGPSDSLYVSDWGLGRLMVYGPSLELVRVQSLDYLPSLILPDGRMVVVEHILKPDLIGYPIHVLNASGALERSFGIDVPESAYDAKLATTRLVASTPAGTIWSVAPGRYVLEHWDPSTGTRLDSFEIDSRDIVPIRKWPDDERLRPPGIIESLWSGDNGWLFLVLRVADEQWKVPARANIERAISADEYDQTYDWAIEVVDPVARRVVARARYPTALWGRPSSGVLVSVDQTDEFTRTKYSILKPAIKSSEVTQ